MLGVSQYPTYQVFLAVLSASILTIALLPFFIRALHAHHIGQQVRADGPQGHLVKRGTPTLGGVVMLLAISVVTLVLGKLTAAVILVLLATLLCGALGLIDDVSKVAHARSLGLTPRAKIVGQSIITLAFSLGVVNLAGIDPTISFPISGFTIDLGVLTTVIPLGPWSLSVPWLYLAFLWVLIVGMSNAVNLTDGLDGLAAGTVMIVMVVMAAIAYRADMVGAAVFAAACAGSCIGFLWFNSCPADIFMGDTGSLALGTAFATLAVITKTEVVSLVIGGLFVVEALSVIIQVLHFKRTGRRVFLMAPIHHHFEKKGWSETKVVQRFWIITAAFASLGFVLYFMGTLS